MEEFGEEIQDDERKAVKSIFSKKIKKDPKILTYKGDNY